ELRTNNFKKAMELMEKARFVVSDNVKKYSQGKYPKLMVKLPESGIEADVWNKGIIEIVNRGDIIARNIDLSFRGNLEVKGIQRIEKLGVGDKRLMEIGLKPKEEGELSVDVLLAYQRAFDDTNYQFNVAKKIAVDVGGTYLIEDVMLIQKSGILISEVSRKLEEDIDRDIFSGMLTAVKEFIKDSFKGKEDTGLRRMDFGENKILLEHGQYTYITTILVGGEPKYLPLYMMEVLKEIEEKYG
ncbi:unnamed protein product, partial [marine sediment metagenome]